MLLVCACLDPRVKLVLHSCATGEFIHGPTGAITLNGGPDSAMNMHGHVHVCVLVSVCDCMFPQQRQRTDEDLEKEKGEVGVGGGRGEVGCV